MYHKASLIVSAAWMVGITLVLFFLPLINGLVGGAVGGYKAGGVKRAIGAALLPALIATILLWAVFALFDAPVIGALAGSTVGFLILFSDVGILAGAAVGGFLAQRRGV